MLVGCKWCDALFHCQKDRTKHRVDLHAATCPTRTKEPTEASGVLAAACKVCKCVEHSTVFSTHHHLLRHLNDMHGARFSEWSVLACDRCGSRNISSLPAMAAHVCGITVRASKGSPDPFLSS